MDIGCGNGRDSLYFERNGLKVVGVDASSTAIDRLNAMQIGNNSMFVCDDFVTCRALYQSQYDYFYSRWTMHAISERQEDELLNNISNSIKREDCCLLKLEVLMTNYLERVIEYLKRNISLTTIIEDFLISLYWQIN